jgi:hypothetical protein
MYVYGVLKSHILQDGQMKQEEIMTLLLTVLRVELLTTNILLIDLLSPCC